jgi:hypothetical protein
MRVCAQVAIAVLGHRGVAPRQGPLDLYQPGVAHPEGERRDKLLDGDAEILA